MLNFVWCLINFCVVGKAEAGNSAEIKAKARNGDVHTPRSDGENTAQSAGSNQSKRSKGSYDKLSFPRQDINNMMLLGISKQIC